MLHPRNLRLVVVAASLAVALGACGSDTAAPSFESVPRTILPPPAPTTAVTYAPLGPASTCTDEPGDEKPYGDLSTVTLTDTGTAIEVHWAGRIAVGDTQGWYVMLSHYQIGVKNIGRAQERFVFDLGMDAKQVDLPATALTADASGGPILTIPRSALADLTEFGPWTASITWNGSDVDSCKAAVTT